MYIIILCTCVCAGVCAGVWPVQCGCVAGSARVCGRFSAGAWGFTHISMVLQPLSPMQTI